MKRSLLLLTTSVLLLGCQTRPPAPTFPSTSGTTEPAPTLMEAPQPLVAADSSMREKSALVTPGDPGVGEGTPRLIKNANLVLFVSSISESLPKINQLLTDYQGDTLSLQETRLSDTSSTATLILRIPQQHLEVVIEKLLTLGQVEQRSITTQDVSEQIFDFEARLRNLRRTEESLLAILNRSGTIAEVLAVTQELSTVRQQIEQLTGQLSRLENQVTYARLTLTLTEERPAVISEPTLWEQLGMTFQEALASLGKLGTSGLKTLIWLLVYSPLVIVPILLLKWWWRSKLR